MYAKLALRNVKKSFRDYAIYFLTLMFGVCIFYVFNSMESQQTMMQLSKVQMYHIQRLIEMMSIFSVFVAVILGALIVYASRFLILRRKKELGIYQVLGMEKGKITRILIYETILVAFLSLACGLALGIFLSQAFAVLTASLFEVKLVGFFFVFSPEATLKAVLYFGIAFVFVMLFNNVIVGRQKLIDLIYADRKNERFRVPRLFMSIVLFILSVVCLTTAYILVIKNGLFIMSPTFLISIILGIVGTFLFFFSLAGFFLKVIKKNKKVYLKGLNMFVLRQLNSKINTTYISMTLVCLMLFVAISALASGLGLSKSLSAETEKFSPFDATYHMFYSEANGTGEDLAPEDYVPVELDLIEEFNNTSIPIDSYAKDFSEIKIYYSSMQLPFLNAYFGDAISLTDYNKLLKMLNQPTVTLEPNECIANSADSKQLDIINNNFNNEPVYIGETLMKLKSTDDTIVFNSTTKAAYGLTFVVPDALIKNFEQRAYMVAMNYIESTHEYNDLFSQARAQVLDNVMNYRQGNAVNVMSHSSQRINNYEESRSLSASVAYLAVYLGIVFLIISAVVLSITQLSETTDNAARYSLLRKLGTDAKMLSKALFSQIVLYFAVPLLLAIVHAIVGISVASEIILQLGERDIFGDSLFAAVVIMLIYGGYFLATFFLSKRIIKQT